MHANKPIQERLINIRLETIRMVQALKVRRGIAAIDEKVEAALAEKINAKHAVALRVRKEEAQKKQEKIQFENYRDDYLREIARQSKYRSTNNFIAIHEKTIDLKMSNVQRLAERLNFVKTQVEKEEFSRMSLTQSSK